MLFHIIIILILVLFNAFFSLAEVALISARKTRLQLKADSGSRAARMALNLQADPDLFLSVAQIGITIVSILTGLYSGASFSGEVAEWLESWLPVGGATAEFVARTSIVVVATYMQCELGELFPKRVAIDMADSMARLSAPLMLFFAHLMKPIVWLLTKNTELLCKLFHLKKEDNHVTEEEIISVIQEGTDSGEVEEVEQDIIERTLALGDQHISSIMTYRTDIICLEAGMTAEQVLDIVRETPYANYPVIEEDMDSVLGFVTLKDLVLRLHQPDFNLREFVQKAHYLPENITVYKALEHLKGNHSHMALICDEFGALSGMLTFRDILEGLVGTIADQTEEPDIIERRDKQSWVVSGQCSFFDFLDYFDEQINKEVDFTTVAGLVLEQLARIPHVGDAFQWKDYNIRVIEMDGNRIEKLLVHRLPAAGQPQS